MARISRKQIKAIKAKKLGKGVMEHKGSLILIKDHAREVKRHNDLEVIKKELASNLKNMQKKPTNQNIIKERNNLLKQRKRIRGF